MSAVANSSLMGRLSDPTLLRSDALIGGVWAPSDSRFEVTNPATGEVLIEVANCGTEATQLAVIAAERALPAWRAKPAKERAAILLRWFTLMNEHRQDLACILTSEQGKPLTEALGEVTYGASFFEWFAEEARRSYGEVVPTHDRQKRLLSIRQPIGVCAAITPWNFPIAMIARKLGPALAAGCTVVVKPAGLTPLSALALAELGLRAGIPAGVINVVTAIGSNSGAVGRVLCESPVVRHLSFTGSTEVGRLLMKQCAPTIKKLALELGGNAPFIVFDDADLESAVEGEAIELANASEYGLASYLFTRDIGRIFRVGEAIESGMVGVNTGLISTAEVPFGGVKQSGLGREGGRQGLDEYLETKYLCLGDIHR